MTNPAKHGHSHSHHHPENSLLLANQQGVYALKISFLGLIITAVLQCIIVYFSQSSALLADTLHNFVDALSSIPLYVAFLVSRRKPNDRYTYGYNRWEDIAGLFILLLIYGSAMLIGWESYSKLKSGHVPHHLLWVVFGSLIGFIGNEWVARYRIKVGRNINSAALIADGNHARADGFTSLGVLIGAAGVYFGYPWLDPVMGLVFALLIIKIGWDNTLEIFSRLADRVNPEIIEEIRAEARNVPQVLGVNDIKARYAGHSLRVEVTIEVKDQLTVLEGHDIAIQVQHVLQKKFPLLISPTIHVDPQGHPGEEHHYEDHHRRDHV